MKTKLFLTSSLFILINVYASHSQIQINGFFNKKGTTNISLSYTQADFDVLYLGDVEADPIPDHDEVNQSIYNLYANYSISDRVTVIVNVPYITADNTSGNVDSVNNTREQSGIQDVSFMVKWAALEESKKNGRVTYVVGLGGSIATGYEPTGILSIGNGAPSIDGKLGLQYNNDSGFFGNIFVGGSIRGKSDNNLNLGNGEDFDVPNSVNAQVKLGYACNIIYADVWFDAQKSLRGVDIGGDNFFGNFPETRVNYSRVGLNLYVPLSKAIGLSGGAGTILDGRNVGKTTYYSGGIVLGLGK